MYSVFTSKHHGMRIRVKTTVQTPWERVDEGKIGIVLREMEIIGPRRFIFEIKWDNSEQKSYLFCDEIQEI